ncbi:Retrovirus-related Pol polyprotein from transposon 412 [Eumeta japonica]|uniref:Retrovirus-related Pol polyprotein from transposon 412 n=1 Tax=Eumeta variegata TaxID=151549 RepID=A0A4C1SDZ1_EUMVA|nr:Retrovirus-related Pol polyprotein from transposon 412 [Eumeta japonica]
MPDAEAETAARIFYNEVITKYGIPRKLITDNGTNFTSKLFGNVCKLLKIKRQLITPYHPQANGALERSHRPLAEYLRSFAKEDGTNWDQWLASNARAQPHSTCGHQANPIQNTVRIRQPSTLKLANPNTPIQPLRVPQFAETSNTKSI